MEGEKKGGAHPATAEVATLLLLSGLPDRPPAACTQQSLLSQVLRPYVRGRPTPLVLSVWYSEG